jgi:hypothetical protein
MKHRYDKPEIEQNMNLLCARLRIQEGFLAL